MNKLWCFHTMEYYSATKRNRLLIHPTTWMALRGIMLSEKSQTQKDYALFNSIYMAFLKFQNYNDQWLSWIREWSEYKGAAKGSLGGDGTVVYPDCHVCYMC